MAYRASRTNIRKPRRRRQTTRRRSVRKAPRRRSSVRRQTTRKNDCVCPGELSPTAKFALAQLDPFEPNALGAKIPDSNTVPSMANAQTDQVQLSGSATAGHLIAIAFTPLYSQATLVATPGATSVTWGGGWTQRRQYTNVVSQIEAIRPVAHAIRMVSPLAPTGATGFVHVGLSFESRTHSAAPANPDLPTTINAMTGLAHYKRFTLASLTQSPITVINKWLDDTAFRYEDPRSVNLYTDVTTTPNTSTFNFNQSWGTIVVMVDSQPASGVPISFEDCILTECIPRKDAFMLGTQAAPNSPGTISAVSTMNSETDFAHTEAQQESYIQQGLSAFERGASVAGERVWNDVAAPLMNRFGSAVINTGVAMALNSLSGRGGLPGVNSNQNRLALG